MNKQEIINSLDAQINETRYEKTRFGDRKDYLGPGFEYAKLDEKIKWLHKVNVITTWLLYLLVSSFVIFYIYKLLSTESYILDSNFLLSFSFFIANAITVKYYNRISREKAKTIKYFLSLKEELVMENVEI